MHIAGKVKEITRVIHESSISFLYIYSVINLFQSFLQHFF